MSDYSLKTIRKQFKDKGVFYTPPELAKMLMEYIPFTPSRVYDPTCGRGNLLSVFGDDIEKYGQDIDADAIADASKRLVNFHGAVGDVLADPKYIDMRFDAIVANPPFSVQWQETRDGIFAFAPAVPSKSKADFAFLIHILWMLSDDGVAVVLNSPGIGYRGGREQIIRQWMIEQNYIDQVVHIPGDTFADTAIATLLLVLKKRRDTTDVHFVDKENGQEKTVTLDAIRSADYTLSVSRYIERIVEKPKVDTAALEVLARDLAITRIRAEIKMSKMIASIEGWDYSEFILDIRKAIDEEAK